MRALRNPAEMRVLAHMQTHALRQLAESDDGARVGSHMHMIFVACPHGAEHLGAVDDLPVLDPVTGATATVVVDQFEHLRAVEATARCRSRLRGRLLLLWLLDGRNVRLLTERADGCGEGLNRRRILDPARREETHGGGPSCIRRIDRHRLNRLGLRVEPRRGYPRTITDPGCVLSRQDRVHVILGFRERRDTVVFLDGTRASVISSQGLPVITEAMKLLAEVFGAALKILRRVIRIDAQAGRGAGHKLGQANGAHRTMGTLTPSRFLPDESFENVRVEPVFERDLPDLNSLVSQ